MKQNNLLLQNKNRELENEVKNVKLRFEENYQVCNNLRGRLERSEFDLKLLKEKEHNFHLKIRRLENRAIEIRNTRRDVHYFEFYDTLVSNIKALFEWPLSMTDLTKPCILPSGNTIQEDCLEELINRRSLDPFNKNLRVQQKIVNRFATEVRDAISKSERTVSNEVDKRRAAEEAKLQAQQNSKSVEIQADLLIRSEDDIAHTD